MTRRSRSCPGAAELARAFSAGPTEDLRTHLSACPRCADEWAGIERVVSLGRELPWRDTAPGRVEQQHTALLARPEQIAPPRRATRRIRWAAAAALAS